MPDTPRIGVYVCQCGTNIGAAVDVPALVGVAGMLPGVVVARHYSHMCSEPGQELIQIDVREYGLTRIVVAACSPLLHEETFRRAVSRAGLNPYQFHMVNIREQVAWVHADRESATRKAGDLIRGAVMRVALQAPLDRVRVPVHPDVLVVGGGIAGIHAALTVANAGRHVTLVEREPSIGGNMARYDKTFPTLDCAACILTPKMTDVRNHPNITLRTYSEVVQVDGCVGSYRVKVRRKARRILEDLCVGCLQCVEACASSADVSDQFNLGLSLRKPIYLPYPQATPRAVVIDPESCIQVKTGKCVQACVEACGEHGAIALDQEDSVEEVQVGSIIVATGFQPFDAARAPEYGYGVLPNVYTTMEVERMITALGPTGGEMVLRDGRTPESIGIIFCVGSRDERYNRWCSRVCCMTALKLSHLLKERTGAEVFNFYIDIRAAGKGYEEFYNRVLLEGAHFVRGKVAEVSDWALDPSEEGKLVIRVEDTLTGFVRRIPVDMVVLAVGIEARHDVNETRRIMNIGCATEGFFLEKHPKLAPSPTATDGVFVAGCCQAPKDIPDTVMQAGYAAAEALVLADAGFIEVQPDAARIVEAECSGCKSCIPLCPYHAISFRDESGKAEITGVLCKGCGVCVAACPSGSIRQDLYNDDALIAEIDGMLMAGPSTGSHGRRDYVSAA